MSTFIQLVREGKILPETIDDFVNEWHTSQSPGSLHEFLGMTEDEYSGWVEDPTTIHSFKPIHPGVILEAELLKRELKPSAFALSIGTYPNAVTEVVNGNRPISVGLALKLEDKLGTSAQYWMYLQADYELAQERLKLTINKLS